MAPQDKLTTYDHYQHLSKIPDFTLSYHSTDLYLGAVSPPALERPKIMIVSCRASSS